MHYRDCECGEFKHSFCFADRNRSNACGRRNDADLRRSDRYDDRQQRADQPAFGCLGPGDTNANAFTNGDTNGDPYRDADGDTDGNADWIAQWFADSDSGLLYIGSAPGGG